MKKWLAVLLSGCAWLAAAAQSPTGSIQGTVEDDAGKPLAQVGVWLSGTGIDLQFTETDQNGFYEFLNLPDGQYAAWLGGGIVVIDPPCGYHAGELTAGATLWWQFLTKPTGGVVIDFGRPVGSNPEVEVPQDPFPYPFNINTFQLVMQMDVAQNMPAFTTKAVDLYGQWFLPKSINQNPVPISAIGFQQGPDWMGQLAVRLEIDPANGRNDFFLSSDTQPLGITSEVATFTFHVSPAAWQLIESNGHTVCLCISTVAANDMDGFVELPISWCGNLYRQPNDTGLGPVDDPRH